MYIYIIHKSKNSYSIFAKKIIYMKRFILLSILVGCVLNLVSCKKKELPQKENLYTTIEITVENENGERISDEYVKMFDEKTYSLFKENHLTKALEESKTDKDGTAIFKLENSKWFSDKTSIELMFTIVRHIDNGNYSFSSKGGSIKKNNKARFIITIPHMEETPNSAFVIEKNILKSIINKNLTYIVLPSEIKGIANNVFEKSNVTEVVLNNGIEWIGDECFLGSKIKKINFPSSLKHIGCAAFQDCMELERADMSNTQIETISESIFLDSGIKEIIFPVNLKKISSESFSGTENLKNVRINESIKEIDIRAFYKSGLTSITLHNSLSQIGYMAFAYCDKLAKIENISNVAENEGIIDLGAFQNCTSLTEITLPDNITRMEGYTFIECKNLKYITLPQSLMSVGEQGLRTNYDINKIVFKSMSVPEFIDSKGKPISNVLPFVKNINEISVPLKSIETYKNQWTSYAIKIKGI